MGEPRRPEDRVTRLAEFRDLMNAEVQATIPCRNGTEWTSDDSRLLQRAASLCVGCVLLDVCRAFSLASGERHGTWGGLTPAQRRRIRRQAAA